MVRVQVELSDDEDKIVQIYRIQHNLKTNEDAIRQIIKHYKPESESKKTDEKSWLNKRKDWLNKE